MVRQKCCTSFGHRVNVLLSQVSSNMVASRFSNIKQTVCLTCAAADLCLQEAGVPALQRKRLLANRQRARRSTLVCQRTLAHPECCHTRIITSTVHSPSCQMAEALGRSQDQPATSKCRADSGPCVRELCCLQKSAGLHLARNSTRIEYRILTTANHSRNIFAPQQYTFRL